MSTDPETLSEHESAAARRIDRAYALALWPSVTGHAPIIFLAPYLNYATGTSIALLGLLSTVGRVYDALYDPLMGTISDRTPIRFGRRKPWVGIGYAAMLLVMVLALFAMPQPGDRLSSAWLAVGLFCFFTSWTTAFIPYVAHAGEITTDYDRRTRINLWQGVTQIVAGLVVYLVPYLLVDPGAAGFRGGVGAALRSIGVGLPLADWLTIPRIAGVANYGAVMTVLVWMTILTLPVIVYRYLRYVPEDRRTPAAAAGSIAAAFRNRIFRNFSFGYLLLIAGYMGRLSLFPFVVTYATGGQYSFLLLMLVQNVSGIVATPLWSRIFGRVERTRALMLAVGVEAAGLVALSLASSFSALAPLAFVAIGLPGGTLYLLPYLMAGDAADYSRWRQGIDNRGVHISIISMILKLGSVFSSATLWLAGLLGFDPAKGIDDGDLLILKTLGLYLPAGLIVAGGLVMARFPINRARHRAIQARLDRRMRPVTEPGREAFEGMTLPERTAKAS
ncbi:MFS transporter [Novosphingobium sp. BL-52-GroH]|uniref:MFS transporter n=1 Tax=Novosphingobium sp. BL-52-GroH TaxID=3349877 RepID=UPI00384E0012